MDDNREQSGRQASDGTRARLVATIHQPPASSVELNFLTGQVIATEPFWFYWTRISQRHARHAEQAADGRLPTEPATAEELLSSLVAVTAAAHALDSLYGAIRPLVTPPRSSAARSRQILETLKLGFDVGRHQHDWIQHDWIPGLDWLFGLRDRAVHHAEGVQSSALQHQPDGSLLGRSYESQMYNAATARQAADLVHSIITHCIRHPKASTKDWSRWKEGLLNILEEPRT